MKSALLLPSKASAHHVVQVPTKSSQKLSENEIQGWQDQESSGEDGAAGEKLPPLPPHVHYYSSLQHNLFLVCLGCGKAL